MALRTVGVRLTAEVSSYVSNMRRATGTTKDFHQSLSQKAAAGHLDAIADRAGVMGIGLAAGFGMAVKSAADFDKQMSAVKAATHASTAEMDKLRAAALKAGADTQYSATEAAKGIEELSKAGVSSADILGGGLSGALSLAAAGTIDVGEAAETAASAMTQFKLKGDQVPHVADLLSAAAGKAQGSVHDMGMALNQAGLVAAQTGLSIEDTTGTLASFASAGLIGSDAGTSFKQMLLMLQAPSGKTKDLMDELGISAYDAQGQFIGITSLAGQLKEKLSKLTPEVRANAMAQIFGADATRAASILYEQGAEGIQNWINKTNDAGYASETAAIKTDNLAGDIERLKGSLDTLMIQGGSGANSGLRILVQALEGMVEQFSKLPSGVGATVMVMGGLTAAVLLMGAGWVKAKRAIAETSEELRKTGPAGEKAAAGLERSSKAAGKAAIAFVALTAAGAAVSALGDQAPNIDRLTKALDEFQKTGQATGELDRIFGNNLEGLGKAATYANDANHGFWKFFNTVQSGIPLAGELSDVVSEGIFGESFNGASQKMQSLDESLSQYAKTQNDAKKAGELWNHVLRKSGLDTEQLAKLLPNTWAQLGELQKAAHGGASATGELSSKTQVLTADMQEAKDKAKELQDAFDELYGQYMSIDKANIKYHETLRSTNKELKKGSRDLRENTEEGGRNRKAVMDLIDAVKDQRDANVNNGMSVDKADKKYRSQIDTLKKNAISLGFNRGEVGKLIDKYRDIPDKIGTTVQQPGMPNAQKQVKNYDKQLRSIAEKITTEIRVHGDGPANQKLQALLIKQRALQSGLSIAAAGQAVKRDQEATNRKLYGHAATGGHIVGPGTGTSDSIPTMLSNGEYVIRAASAKKIGYGDLDHLNRFGELPQRFASGGRVSAPFDVDASKTKVPTLDEVLSKVSSALTGSGGSAGKGWQWMVSAVRAAFPGIGVYSTFRKNSRTLSGNRSYHSVGRAVDFAPSKELAEWINANYFSQTRELITPWNSLNIHNGRRHTYTGAIFRQHNFAGGNAHDHWAMAHGGIIGEPVFGVGRSGRTYSFGEMGPERVIPHYANGGLVNFTPTTPTTTTTRGSKLDTAEAILAAKNAVDALTQSLKQNGRTWSANTAKGRDNRQALIAGVKAAQEAAKAKYAETGSIKAADAVYKAYIKSLDASMKKMGVNAKARRELLKAYGERPKYDVPSVAAAAPRNSSNLIKATQDHIGIEDSLLATRAAFAWTKPTFNLKTETGRAELNQLFGFLQTAAAGAQSMYDYMGSKSQAMSYYNGYINQLRAVLIKSGMKPKDVDALIKRYGMITLEPKANRWGGLYEHAADGKLTDAMISGAGTRYAWAEPSTGGELFAPKHGNLQKTRSQVGWAVQNWWGGQVNWGQGGRGGKFTINATIPITLGAETITRQVRLEVDTAVGQIANATVYQTA